MTRRLIVMRHAKSDWANANLSDHDRPLNDRGRRVAPQVGQHFATQKLLPQAIIASTASRVRETLSLLLPALPFEPQLFFEQALYLATSDTLAAHVRGLHDSWTDAMLVGHNPGLSEFVSRLSARSIEMPTAAVVILESNAVTWVDAITSKLWHLTGNWKPRELFQ